MLTVGSSAAISIGLEFQELFLFGLGACRRAGAGLVLGDELFEVPLLGQYARVDAFVLLFAFLAVFTIGVDLSGIHRQLAARQVKRMVAGRPRNARSCDTIRHASS